MELTALPAGLQTLASFGFRGEALSSLCAVSDLMVTTRTAGDVTGSRVTYNSSGQISSQISVARAKGTTVALRELFKPLPVRRKVTSSSTQPSLIAAFLEAASPLNACFAPRQHHGMLLPSQELLRNVRREFGKLLGLLQAYAVVGTGVRIICTNQVSTVCELLGYPALP